MKGLFHSKDHKKAKSAKLQQQLQLQEDKLWRAELERRKQQELLDEEMARKLAEEYGDQPSAPSPRVEQEMSDEQLARMLQEEFENNERQSGATRNPQHEQELSDEQLARRLQEEFEAAEREERQRRQESSPRPEPPQESPVAAGAPPPLPSKPTAYNHHSASSLRGNTPQAGSSSSSLATPARPGSSAREVPPPPYGASSSSGNAAPHLPPRDFGASTPSPQQVPPSPVGGRTAPIYSPSNNVNGASPTSPTPVTNQPTYPPVTQQGYHQQHAFANTAPPSSPSQPHPYHAPKYPSSSQTPAPHQQASSQSSQPAAAQALPQSPVFSYPQQPLSQQNHHNYVQQQQQASYSEHKPAQQQQAPYPEHQQIQQQPYAQYQQQQPEQPYGAPQQQNNESHAHAQQQHAQHQQHQVHQPQPQQQQEASAQSMGATLFGSSSALPTRKEPMMFVVPSEPMPPYLRQENSSTPVNQYMAMPVPPPVNRSPSPASYPKDTKPPQSNSAATHVSPLIKRDQSPSSDSRNSYTPKQPPAPILKSSWQKPHEEQVEYRNVARADTEDDSDDDNQDLISYVRKAEAGETKKFVKGKGRRVRKSDDESDPFADSFAVEASSTESSSEEESEEEEEEEEETQRRRAPPPPVVKKKEPAKQKKDEPEFNPAEYFDEEDLVDLNAPSDYDTDDSGSSADDESDTEETQKKQRVKKPIVPPVATLLDLDDPVPEVKEKEVEKEIEEPVKERTRAMVIEPKTPVEDRKTEPKKPASDEPKENTEQKKPTEKPKLAPGRATATRWDPTFSSSLVSLSVPIKKPESNKIEQGSPPPLERQGSDVPSPSVSVMQARLAGILVDDNKGDEGKDNDADDDTEEPRLKGDKTQETIDAPSRRSPSPMMYHNRSRSAGSLMPQDIGSAVPYHQQLHHTPYVAHTTYDDMAYMATPQVYPANVLRAGAPPGVILNDGESPGSSLYSYPNFSTSEVPSGEYGYYRIDAEANNSSVNLADDSDAKSNAKRVEKALPKIPKTDPNHRHITVPSINPGQRVWIRVNPTDTGKSLAQRIHIVATYKSRKILSIKTANGRDIPLNDTAVFEDWHEIETLEDGDPWEVEWGPLDHSFIGGRQLMKKLKAGLREAVKE